MEPNIFELSSARKKLSIENLLEEFQQKNSEKTKFYVMKFHTWLNRLATSTFQVSVTDNEIHKLIFEYIFGIIFWIIKLQTKKLVNITMEDMQPKVLENCWFKFPWTFLPLRIFGYFTPWNFCLKEHNWK